MLIMLLVAAGICLLGALILAFMPRVWASVAALASLWCVMLAMDGWHSWPVLLFWSVATALVLGIHRLSAGAPAPSRIANAYVSGGALAGAVVGMIMTTSAAVIIGAAVGAFCGAFAFSRTPGGRGLDFPTAQFATFLVRTGLPAVVVMSMVAIAFGSILMPATT